MLNKYLCLSFSDNYFHYFLASLQALLTAEPRLALWNGVGGGSWSPVPDITTCGC